MLPLAVSVSNFSGKEKPFVGIRSRAGSQGTGSVGTSGVVVSFGGWVVSF